MSDKNICKSLQKHINDNIEELYNYDINSQRKRHLETELESLEKYKNNHPNSDCDPTPLELFCDSNPDALECRIYEEIEI